MQTAATSAAIPVAGEWCRQHFDYLSPQLSGVLLPQWRPFDVTISRLPLGPAQVLGLLDRSLGPGGRAVT